MSETKWKQIHAYQCPCGYQYEPDKGCSEAGYKPGTPFEELPESLTCPRCQRPRFIFVKNVIRSSVLDKEDIKGLRLP